MPSLWPWRYTLNGLGLVHTFLCGGVVFGCVPVV